MTPAARREAVQQVRERFPISERRACGLVEIERSSYQYQGQPRDDGPLREALRQAAAMSATRRLRLAHVTAV